MASVWAALSGNRAADVAWIDGVDQAERNIAIDRFIYCPEGRSHSGLRSVDTDDNRCWWFKVLHPGLPRPANRSASKCAAGLNLLPSGRAVAEAIGPPPAANGPKPPLGARR